MVSRFIIGLPNFTTVSPPLTHFIRGFSANFNTFYSILLVYEAVKLPKVCQFQPRKSLKSIFQKLFTFFSQESAFLAIKEINCEVKSVMFMTLFWHMFAENSTPQMFTKAKKHFLLSVSRHFEHPPFSLFVFSLKMNGLETEG